MEDIVAKEIRLRNMGANIVMLIGGIFIIGAAVFTDGFMAQPLIKYSLLVVGILLLIFGIVYRFQKVSGDYEYA